MEQEAIKLELIEWLSNLNDPETLNYLKVVKDSMQWKQNISDDLSEQHKLGIKRGLKDIDEGRIVSHNDVKKKYGL